MVRAGDGLHRHRKPPRRFMGRLFEISAGLCEELAQHALGRYAVSVIGEEPWLADR
jgi:hypothetical protein